MKIEGKKIIIEQIIELTKQASTQMHAPRTERGNGHFMAPSVTIYQYLSDIYSNGRINISFIK